MQQILHICLVHHSLFLPPFDVNCDLLLTNACQHGIYSFFLKKEKKRGGGRSQKLNFS